MSDTENEYGGRGLPKDYEPYDDEISSYTYALLSLMHDAELKFVGWDDDAPKYKDDMMVFVFDHPDEEGGFMVPIRYRDLEVLRAVNHGGGYWTAVEDVGVFDPLPDWVNHHPSEPHEVESEDMGVKLHCPKEESTVLSDAADSFSFCPYCGTELGDAACGTPQENST